MVIILDENFNVTAVSDAVVNQGDAALGKIQVITPYPNNIALVASFTLPDGTVTPRYPLVSSISATDKTKTIYTLNVPATVFSLISGSVQVQFFALLPNSGQTNEYSVLLNVKSGSVQSLNEYAITDTYICDKSLTNAPPQIIQTAQTSGLEVIENESNNAYYLSGGLSTANTPLTVTVKVTYATPQTIATTATNFTIRKGTAFDLPSFGDIDQNTWTYIVQTLAELESGISEAINASIKQLSGTNNNMWALPTGYYKALKGTVINLTTDKNQTIESSYEDMLVFVENNNVRNASYVVVFTDKDSTGSMPMVPFIYYGYSDGNNWRKETFRFGKYLTKIEVQSMINAAVTDVINTPI